MIQPHIGQRVTVIDDSGPESGTTGVIIRLPHLSYWRVTIKADSGGSFTAFPCRLRAAVEKST